MTVDLIALIEELAAEPKAYIQDGLSHMTFFRARAGAPVSLATAAKFLLIAQQRDPRVTGLRLATGQVIYAADAMERARAEIDQLASDNVKLMHRIRALEGRRWRELVKEGELRLRSLTHSQD